MKLLSYLTLVLIGTSLLAQNQTKRVLFIGNSYTYSNSLPQMLADVANSTNDTIIFDNNTPGGYTLELHSTNTTTLAKIAQGSWDYVVLQEQSQLPSFPTTQVQTSVFPFAKRIDSLIIAANTCTETMFFMTWGRKNGDASNCQFFTPLCTYQGMDSLLNLRYRQMADSNHATLSPVGAVWNHIRTTYPLIDLYSVDESHPSVKGTYAAACTFYASILRKDPTLINFNSTLSLTEANQIKAAAKLIAYDSLPKWHIGEYDADATFSVQTNQNQVHFTSDSTIGSVHFWDFGDNTTSTLANPFKTYNSTGNYLVRHLFSKCSTIDSTTQNINVLSTQITQSNLINDNFSIYPNPAADWLTIKNKQQINFKLQLYSSQGELVKDAVIEAGENAIRVTGLSNGIYIVKLISAGKIMHSKTLIKR